MFFLKKQAGFLINKNNFSYILLLLNKHGKNGINLTWAGKKIYNHKE